MATPRLCSVEGCGKKFHAKNLCADHRYRERLYGHPLAGKTEKGAPLAWLRAHVDHSDEGCLIWPFGRVGRERGTVKVDGQQTKASRVMCVLAHGESPPDRPFALHSCGKGHEGCVHPKHLYWGNQKQNKLDTIAHGTHDRGERNVNSVLTEDAVRAIRRDYRTVSTRDLADRYGVSTSRICLVANRQSWAWLD